MTSKTIMISGIKNDVGRNILFQSAVYWAEEGCKVLYIAKSKFDSIPSSGHGPQIPSSEVLAKIRIVYLECMEELLKFVVDVLTFRDLTPRVMLVEELEEYSRESDHWLARACATLCHVATCCATRLNLPTYLLVTVATTTDKLPPVICSMFDSMWCYNSECNTVTRTLPVDLVPTAQMTLASRSDGALVLREVSHLFVKH
uniref:Uncharacterized protein n=1 Tax=Graphocephala atropunctata TaxID=36148 RepID=A0A1B6MA93_9HEMI